MSASLRCVLRLIHCVQKERGASCALVGERNTRDDAEKENPYKTKLKSARTASNSAISSFYNSEQWIKFCTNENNDYGGFELAATLHRIRRLVDGGVGDKGEDEKEEEKRGDYWNWNEDQNNLFFHDILMEYNSFLQSIIQVFVVDEVYKRRKDIQLKINTQKENESRRNSKIALNILDLVFSFVKLKEALGMERATLTGLMANTSNTGTRLNLIVNDLVMIVENQYQILSDLNCFGLDLDVGEGSSSILDTSETEPKMKLDDNHSTLFRLVQEAISPSETMRAVQDHVTKDFDIEMFQKAMSMGEFWVGITTYMDKLHSMELFLLEELENCEGTYEDLDLLSLATDTSKANTPTSSPSKSKDIEREWEISLYDVQFHKRIGRGSAGTTYQGTYCNQEVAVKVAATSDMGLEGWQAELSSLKKLHHTNIIRFFGAIYNPSPITYCLVLEYCSGGDLSEALAHNTPTNFFSTISSGVANALYYLHKLDFLHRDIKPGNVLISGDLSSGSFVAKLTDFGLAVKVQNTSQNDKNLTAETGTYRYMAPEVIRHEQYDYAADIFSFALVMWEIITREKPFASKSQIEAAAAVAIEGKRPPFPDDTPTSVKELIESCWAEKPSERMKVEDIINCLDALASDVIVQEWISHPTGHQVYAAQDTVDALPVQLNNKVQKKKRLSSLFRKKE